MRFRLNGVLFEFKGDKWGYKDTRLNYLSLVSHDGKRAMTDIKINNIISVVEGIPLGCFNIQ